MKSWRQLGVLAASLLPAVSCSNNEAKSDVAVESEPRYEAVTGMDLPEGWYFVGGGDSPALGWRLVGTIAADVRCQLFVFIRRPSEGEVETVTLAEIALDPGPSDISPLACQDEAWTDHQTQDGGVREGGIAVATTLFVEDIRRSEIWARDRDVRLLSHGNIGPHQFVVHFDPSGGYDTGPFAFEAKIDLDSVSLNCTGDLGFICRERGPR